MNRPRVFLLLAAGVALVALVVWSMGRRSMGPSGLGAPVDTGPAIEGEGSGVARVAESGTGLERVPIAEASPMPGSDCAFFDGWKGVACSADSVSAFLDELSALSDVDLACVPSEWLLWALLLHCEGRRVLSSSDLVLIATEVSTRMPNAAAIESCGAEPELSAESLPCLIAALSHGAGSQEDVGRFWAWGLRVVFEGRCDLFSADPEVVAELVRLMADWPIGEDAWWASLWGGIQEDASVESAGLRVAIYEGLYEVLPRGQWVDRMTNLSTLEEPDTFGGLSLWGMGDTIARHVSSEEYFTLVSSSESGGAEWARAMLFGFPHGASWPGSGHLAVPEPALEAISLLRDSESYPYGAELLGRQWELLGPVEAAADLERFVFLSDSNSHEWDYRAGARIEATVAATLVEGASPGDLAALEHASSLVRDFVLTASPRDSDRVLAALRDRGLSPSGREEGRRWRAQLVKILGPDGMSALGSEFREWLAAP